MNRDQIIAVIIIGLGLVVGSVFVYRFQKLSVKEDKRDSVGSIVFKGGEISGDVRGFDLLITTGDLENDITVPISSISIKAEIDNGGVTDLRFVNEKQENIDSVYIPKEVSGGDEWLIPVNSIYQEDGKYFLELVAVNTKIEGFSSLIPFKLGSIYIKTSSLNKPTIKIVKDYTKIMSKEKPVVNILP